MKVAYVKGSTSVILTVFIRDSSQTDGRGLGGLVHTSSIVGGYVRAGGTGVALAVDEDVATEGTYQAPSAAGKVRIGTPANMPTGFYELHFHNNLFAAGANVLTIGLGGAANMAPLNIEVQLTDLNLNDPVRAGLTALPNAPADGVGGLPISDTGGLDLDTLLGRLDAAITTRLAASGYTAPLDAAGTRTALGMASNDLDTQLAALAALIATADAVCDAIKVVTDQLVAAQAEPGAVPAANASPLAKIAWMGMLHRNKITQTATTQAVRNDADSADVATAAVSDAAGVFARGKFV